MQSKSKNESPAQPKRKPAKSLPPLATGPHYLFEIEHGARTRRVCGIDEAGRGPLAGPVVAAAVIIDQGNCPPGLDDSKKLGLNRREDLFAQLSTCAEIGVGFASVEEIDRLNILWASMLAMSRAVENLKIVPHFALVDGNRLPKIACPGRAIIGGDGLALSIAAASIVAKVTRDRIMAELASTYPGYGWEKNRGYGTKVHLNALSSLGATPHHRRSFAPIRNMLSPNEAAGLDLVDENPLSL